MNQALHSAAVSSNYFSLLGVTPDLGRTLQGGEDETGRDRVVVLSHEIWEQRFGSYSSVIGVMPASFRMLGYTPQLWTPLVLTAREQTASAHSDRSLQIFGRLKSGV